MDAGMSFALFYETFTKLYVQLTLRTNPKGF